MSYEVPQRPAAASHKTPDDRDHDRFARCGPDELWIASPHPGFCATRRPDAGELLVRPRAQHALGVASDLCRICAGFGVAGRAAKPQPLYSGKNHRKGTQSIAQGPVVSQIAIKQLGMNGGGFFNSNSAHPFDNPTPLTNFLEVLGIFAIGAGLPHTFGKMAGDRRQGWALYGTMGLLFLGAVVVCTWAEQRGNPQFASIGINQTASAQQSGGNMEGKEVRFGIVNSTIWATATTDASNGSVNAMHDSLLRSADWCRCLTCI